jgi:PAS domain S-box-containing protein
MADRIDAVLSRADGSRATGQGNMATEPEQDSSVRVLPNGPVRPSEAEAFRVSLNLLPEPALVFAIDGTILQANPSALSLLEANEDQLIGTSIYLLRAMEPEKTRDAAAHLARGTTIRFEIDLCTLKGNRCRVDIINMPVVAAGGKVECVISFARDLSERRQAESDWALMAAMVESSGDAIMSVALDGTITSWNRRAEEIFGFTQAKAIGQPFLIIVPPEKRPLAMAMVEEIKVKRGRVINFEGIAQRKDGSFVEIWMTLFGIYNRGGKLLGVSSIIRDSTEQKLAEREQALLAAIVESSDDAIISLSPEFKIMTWNKGAQKLFGFTAAEAIGKTNLELYVPPEDRERVIGWMREDFAAIRSDPASVRRLEWLGKKNDGSPVDIALSVSGIQDNRGNVTGISLIMRDITEHKRAARELALLATIVNASQDAIINVTTEGKIGSRKSVWLHCEGGNWAGYRIVYYSRPAP